MSITAETGPLGICRINFNRPEKHNAFDDEFITEFTRILNNLEKDPNSKIILIKAEGKSFCAGADIQWMQRMAKYSMQENLADAHALAGLMRTLRHIDKPTIALIQGPTLGGGVGIAACCDVAIASEKASFCLSEVKIGMIPAVISPYVINAIGERQAMRYFLTAETMSAEDAKILGLVHKIVEHDKLIDEGEALARKMLANSPAAMHAAKQLINQISRKPIDTHMINDTVQRIASIRVSPEGQEGLNAFLEKRDPAWKIKDV